jgi:hypothetical protein
MCSYTAVSASEKQIDACAAIVAESTRVERALRRQWKHQERVDWVPWNEALARVSLVAGRAVVDAAGDINEVFWRRSDRIDRGLIKDEAGWLAGDGSDGRGGRSRQARFSDVDAWQPGRRSTAAGSRSAAITSSRDVSTTYRSGPAGPAPGTAGGQATKAPAPAAP